MGILRNQEKPSMAGEQWMGMWQIMREGKEAEARPCQPTWSGAYTPRAVLATLTFHQNHLGSVLKILVRRSHSRTTQSRLLEVRPRPKFCLCVCLLVVRPPDDFIAKFGMRIIALQQRGNDKTFKRCILCVFGGRWMSSSDLHFKKHPLTRTME